MRDGLIACVVVLALAAPVGAQLAEPRRVSLDSVVALDETVDTDGNHVTGVIADTLASVDLGGNVQFIARPFARRLASGDWDAEVWIAALRYERPGPIGVRVDGGLIPSPLGMANLLLRPHMNPTIAQPSSLFTPLPPPLLRGPRTNLLGALYPLGVSATASTLRWDLRAAVIDSSPLRARDLFGEGNAPRFFNQVIGGGVTPFVGFRVGASLARGGWLNAGESPVVTADRNATIVTVESEFSYRYTKLLGEWTRDRMDTDSGTRIARGFFVQGQQTLSPRWFVAGRVERMASPAPAVGPGESVAQTLTGIEETLGYRLTADLTLRASHRARRLFGARSYGQTAAVSVVWWKRIM